MSTNSGVSWSDNYNSGLGTGGITTFVDTGITCDPNGTPFSVGQRSGNSIIFRLTPGSYTNGIKIPNSVYGRAISFTHDGYAIPFGDIGNYIRCKVNDKPYSATTLTGWPGYGWFWDYLPDYTVAPIPSRLSRVDNVVRPADNSIYLIYFSSSTDTWIRMSYNADGTGTSWNSGNVVYDGASDGYTGVHDPSLFLDGDGDFHSAFIANDGLVDNILYTRSTDGLSWDTPLIAYTAVSSGTIKDPTVKTMDVDSDEFLILQYLDGNEVYITFSWDAGAEWQEPVLISDTDNALMPDFDITVDGYIHSAWEHDTGTDHVIEYIRAYFET